MINVIKGVDLFEHIKEYDATLIGTNTYCTLSGSLPRKISLHYPYVDSENLSTKYGDNSKLGSIKICEEENNPTFVLLYVVGWPKTKSKESWIDYGTLERCLKLVNIEFKNKRIACPMLCTYNWDGNGDKENVLQIMEETLTDVEADVFDYVPLTRQEEYLKSKEAAAKILKENGVEKYAEYIKKVKEEKKKLREINGHASE